MDHSCGHGNRACQVRVQSPIGAASTSGADVTAVALGAGSWQTDGVGAQVRLSGELSGAYVVDEVFEDGRIVLRPDTSAAAIRERAGLDPVTDDEFEQAFGHLPSDSEG